MINPDLILALLILYMITCVLIVGDGFDFLRDILNFMRSKVEDFKAKKATPNVFSLANNNEYVDLGLSVKWASCNVGANSPEEFGNYLNYNEAIKISGLPTKEQWEELRNKCKFKYDKKKKVIVVTGPNGNTIFFPMACDRDGVYDKIQPGAYFWSTKSISGNFENYAYYFFFIKEWSGAVSPNFSLLGKSKNYISVRTVQ